MIFINVLVKLYTWGKINMLEFIKLKGSKGSLELYLLSFIYKLPRYNAFHKMHYNKGISTLEIF